MSIVLSCKLYFHVDILVTSILYSIAIGPFRHSDISVKAVNQHGGRFLIYIV